MWGFVAHCPRLTRRFEARKRRRDAAATLATIRGVERTPPNAIAATTASELTPTYSIQRHKATTPATIAAIGKPRPASGSLKKNIDAKDLRRFRVTRPFDSRRGESRRVVSTRDGE